MKRLASLIAGIACCGILVTYGVTQETPVGVVRGKLTMKENGRPLAGEYVSIDPKASGDDAPRSRAVQTEEDGSFVFRGVPIGTYLVHSSTKSHQSKEFAIDVDEGKEVIADVEAAPVDPYMHLYCSQKVFTSDEKPKIELHGFLPNSPGVKVGLYRISLNQIEKAGSLQKVLSPLSREDPGDLAKLEAACEHVRDLDHAVKKVDAEGAFIDTIDVGELTTGVYFVECSSGKERAGTAVYVSDLGLVTKTSEGKMLCYTTHLKTGKPETGVDISVLKDGKLQPVGKTDQDGLLDVNLPKADDYHALVVAQTKDSVAFIGYRDRELDSDKLKIVGYCERPAYRPGDEIQFKGIVREKTKDGYALPKPSQVEVKVKDPDDNVIETLKVSMNAHGTFNGKFTTSKEGKPGSYHIECTTQQCQGGIYANVVAYRKPEYSIEVRSDKPFYTMGDEASATVECKYYYGGPVVGAKVKASVYRSPKWGYGDDGDSDEEYDEDRYSSRYYRSNSGEYSEEVEAVTDATGRATIKFPTRGQEDPEFWTNDYSYRVNASVTEDDAKYFDGEGEVSVVRGDHNVLLEVQNPLVMKGDTVDLLVKTTDPTKPNVAYPNQPILIEVGHSVWTKRELVFVPKRKIQTTTGANGEVHVPIKVDESESMELRATSIDKRGNKVVDEASVWVEGSPAQFEEEQGKIEVTLDKRKYQAGDIAKAVIQTDKPGGSALVTFESDGVIRRQVVPMTSQSTMITLPIQQEFSPNIFVTVAYVHDKKFMEAQRRLDVGRKDRDLKVDIQCDKEVYKPGDTALVSLKTTDLMGKPVAADVSVGVVDEGIYDIAPDDTNLMLDFYPKRSNEVETSYSFPEIYLDGGDKGTSKIPLRKTFRDTAQWNPSVWTGTAGQAQVRVKLPDNLTQWRVTAVGVSDQTSVGMSKQRFRAKKDLMLRLELPQYLVSGDQQRMTIVVANDTGQDQDVHLETSITGGQVGKAFPKSIRVPNGKPQTIECEVTAGDPGACQVTARAWIDGGSSDGVQQSFEIQPHGREVLVSQAGEGTSTFTLEMKPTADAKYGELSVNLSPTLVSDMVSSLDGLIGYPYGCVEQTMSRFLPSVLVDKAVRDLGLPRPKNLDELPKIVRDSLARLSNMRHRDGGFGWWEYDTSDAFMTALVLDGIDRAKEAGIDTSSLPMGETLEWGMKWLKSKEKDKSFYTNRDRFYLIYALHKWSKNDAASYLNGLDLSKMNPGELAQIALTYHAAGKPDLANQALNLLSSKAQGQDVAYWANGDGYWGAELPGVALVAYATIRPTDSIIPRIVHYLQVSKQGDMWYSTRDTAYALIGMTTFARTTKELLGTSNVEVLVNGRRVGKLSLDPKILSAKEWNLRIPKRDLGNGDVRVQIRTEGTGKCYYSAQLRTLDTDSTLKPYSTDSAISVDRAYYKLEPRRVNSGAMKLMPSDQPVTSFQSGDLILVKLKIKSNQFRQFVMVNEPVPSSCHIQERDDISDTETWGYWWGRTVIRDDRIVFFSRDLTVGDHEIRYVMRAEQSGKARALPTTVGNMYDPGHVVSTGENTIEVTR